MGCTLVEVARAEEVDMVNREPGGSTERHFGNVVDRGGRMAPSRSDTTSTGGGVDLAAERGPHWGKGPKGYTRSDERTREDVCDAIARQGHIDATDVDVKVENGTVTLSGTVALREHELSLERLVKRCLGVRDVRSDLRLIRLAIGVLLMFGVMACRQGDPAIDPKTPANSPVPTRLERPDDGPASPSMPRLVPDGGGAAR